jgi:RNA polymerase sigma-70 factor (ECF subfamily)
VPTAANRLPAVAVYLRREGDDRYRLLGLDMLEIHDGQISAITSFSLQLLGAFRFPQTLPADR